MNNGYAVILALLLATTGTTARSADSALPSRPHTDTTAGQRLAELTGLWSVKQELWLQPGPPQVDTGTAMFAMVLGGRQLQQDLRVGSRVPFQALGYIGYDPATRRYISTWMDLNLTEVIVMRGSYDTGTRTYRLSGDMAADDGQRIPTREELQQLDDGHFVVRYFETRRGKETLVVQLAYSRR
ncbi:DUF1579 family protein [Lysobacter claricitrinus]|uniref:DUF1579 family protein n=1 Tax=Lysobacter claricitrinus TaxID=3367728 RepID=UPI0037DA9CEC